MQADYFQPLSQPHWVESEESIQQRSSEVPLCPSEAEPTAFHSHFVGTMELAGDPKTVSQYLNAHQGWFCRCAQPMTAEPMGESGYLLTIGRYGSFGFEIEPRIGLHLLPPDAEGVYRIEVIPDSIPQEHGYQVDFQAALRLIDSTSGSNSNSAAPTQTTHVEWTLNLGVVLQFPRFIRRLPNSLIQKTGDRVLTEIVRQVSRRLTAKVQQDFQAHVG
jgi:hypothetical protein